MEFLLNLWKCLLSYMEIANFNVEAMQPRSQGFSLFVIGKVEAMLTPTSYPGPAAGLAAILENRAGRPWVRGCVDSSKTFYNLGHNSGTLRLFFRLYV
jgi:hypothetical protein